LLNLGSFLKDAREEKGLSLDDVQELTKIKVAYLKAIEEGKYDELPGLFYVKAFVKTYCEALGLPAHEVMDIYQSDLPGGKQTAPVNHNQDMVTENEPKPPGFFSRWGSSLIVWSVAIIILLAIYYFVTSSSSDDGEKSEVKESVVSVSTDKSIKTEEPVQVNPKPQETEKPQVKVEEKKVEEKKVEEKREPVANPVDDGKNVVSVSQGKDTFEYSVKNSKTVKMQLTATGECYVHYGPTDKSKIYELTTLQKGQSIEWTNDASTLLRIGAMENVQLTVNGEPIELSGYLGVRTLIFDVK
jgi:hypothetical protein